MRGTKKKTNRQWSLYDWKSRQAFISLILLILWHLGFLGLVSPGLSRLTQVSILPLIFLGLVDLIWGRLGWVGILHWISQVSRSQPINTHVSIFLPWIYKVGMFQLVVAWVNKYLPQISKVSRTQLVPNLLLLGARASRYFTRVFQVDRFFRV